MVEKLIGIDIGGTKISVALGTSRGKILKSELLPTLKGREGALESIENLMEATEVISGTNLRKNVLGVGVGLPGPVDSEKGVVPFSPHMRGWRGLPLRRILEQRFRVPTFLDNDANAAALGEKRFGAGKRARDFIYLTVSTGIGAGLVLHGKLYHGRSFCAGEVGHMTLIPNGKLCKCGKKGCLETYASGTAIRRDALESLRQGKKTMMHRKVRQINEIQAEVVAACAKEGDRLAQHIIENAGFHLGLGLGSLMNILNPELIVVGGSVVKSGSFYWEPMMEGVKKTAWQESRKVCRIVKTALRDYVGNLGAIGLVLENLRP